MKARLGAVLFGIGILLVVVAGGLAFYVAPAVTKLPYDLKLCKSATEEDCLQPSVAEATNARFLQLKGAEGGAAPVIAIQTGTARSTTEVKPRPDKTAQLTGDLKDSAVVWDVFGTVVWVETGDKVLQYSASLALDRVSAAAQPWDKQSYSDVKDGPTDVSFSGQTYKFPFHTQKKDYQYFDRDLRTALPIKFQGTEKIKGVEAYRFQQVIPETELTTFGADRLNALLGKFAPEATGGKVTYRNTRTIWVEPVSGTFVKVQEQQGKTLVPDQGSPTTLLDGTFTYTDKTITNSVKTAKDTRSQLLMIGRYLPIGLAVLGALALIAGLVLAYSATHRRASRHRSGGSDDTVAYADDTAVDDVPAARSS